MSKELFIPLLNPVYFYEVGRTIPAQYHTKFFTDFTPMEHLKPWQGYGKYFQKWQTNDSIPFQFISNAGPITIQLKTCKGVTVRVLAMTQKQASVKMPGYFIYEGTLSLVGVQKGRHRIRVQVGNGAGPDVDAFESDWIDIAEDWPHTVLIEYKNSFFYGDAVFETGWTGQIRVEGWFKPMEPKSKDELYTDQTYNQTMSFSDPFYVQAFIIGPGTGVPDWMPYLLNWVMGCDEVYYDGLEFTKADGAKMEEISQEGVPFRGFTIDLQPTKRRSSKIFDIDGDPQKKILIALNVETQGFADTGIGTSSDVIQIAAVE